MSDAMTGSEEGDYRVKTSLTYLSVLLFRNYLCIFRNMNSLYLRINKNIRSR